MNHGALQWNPRKNGILCGLKLWIPGLQYRRGVLQRRFYRINPDREHDFLKRRVHAEIKCGPVTTMTWHKALITMHHQFAAIETDITKHGLLALIVFVVQKVELIGLSSDNGLIKQPSFTTGVFYTHLTTLLADRLYRTTADTRQICRQPLNQRPGSPRQTHQPVAVKNLLQQRQQL